MVTPQELKFIWLNMAKQLGNFDGEDDWCVFIQEGDELSKVTVHIGWHTLTIEVFDVDENQTLTEAVAWKVNSEEDIPGELFEFLKNTLNNGTWMKEVPENWGIVNYFIGG